MWLFCTGVTLGAQCLWQWVLLCKRMGWGKISSSCLQCFTLRCAWSIPCLRLEFAPLWGTFHIFPLCHQPCSPWQPTWGAQLCGWAGSGKEKTSRVLLHSPLQVPRAKPRVGWDLKRRQVKWPKNCTAHLPKSRMTTMAPSLSRYLFWLPLSYQKNYGQINQFVLLLPSPLPPPPPSFCPEKLPCIYLKTWSVSAMQNSA